MTEAFLCKVEGRLGGDSGDLKEVRLLNRIIRWTPPDCYMRQTRVTRSNSCATCCSQRVAWMSGRARR
eukprot:14406552-Alexandrium_andersonii.AAC.1